MYAIDRPTAVLVIGTRPEAIKLCPVAMACAEHGLVEPLLVTTGQHGAVVEDILALFGLQPHVALSLTRGESQRLPSLHAALLHELDRVLHQLDPAVVVVQGDTATVLAGAQTAFLQGRPVVHVEAGLRSGSLEAPFPEEGNRRMVAAITSLHLAPTAAAAANLLLENHNPARVLVTGNTVVDALRHVAATTPGDRVAGIGAGRQLVVVTAHRRESWGDGMRNVASAVATLAERHPEALFAVVTHMNPAVRSVFERHLHSHTNVWLSGPLDYGEFVKLLAQATVVLTDSGGVQEEAPALGVPVVVLRERTERGEGVDVGAAVLVGTDPAAIVSETDKVLLNRQWGIPGTSCAPDLYGDGRAGARSAQAIAWLLGEGRLPEPFSPSASADVTA